MLVHLVLPAKQHHLPHMQCVIGAGAAGLVAARELLHEGHNPTVFEQGARPGGVWVYTDGVEEGSDAPVVAGPVHSSMYRNLRTNLPREVMAYSDFPFTRVWRDARRFCGHEEVSPRMHPAVVSLLVLHLLPALQDINQPFVVIPKKELLVILFSDGVLGIAGSDSSMIGRTSGMQIGMHGAKSSGLSLAGLPHPPMLPALRAAARWRRTWRPLPRTLACTGTFATAPGWWRRFPAG